MTIYTKLFTRSGVLIIEKHSKTLFTSLNEYGQRDNRWNHLAIAFTFPGLLALIIGMGGFAAIVCLFLYLQDTSEKPRQALVELEREFQAISPPPDAVGSDYFGSHKLQHALVSEHFKTALTFDQVRAYYDTQFQKDGWQFVANKPSYDWGRDLGGRVIDYRKGAFVAELYDPGDTYGAGYDYSLSISWGMK